jgi:hypothetical protein
MTVEHEAPSSDGQQTMAQRAVSGEAAALRPKRPWQTPRLVVHAVDRSASGQNGQGDAMANPS